jgi:hypothetical protein
VTAQLADAPRLFFDYEARLNTDEAAHVLGAGLKLTW